MTDEETRDAGALHAAMERITLLVEESNRLAVAAQQEMSRARREHPTKQDIDNLHDKCRTLTATAERLADEVRHPDNGLAIRVRLLEEAVETGTESWSQRRGVVMSAVRRSEENEKAIARLAVTVAAKAALSGTIAGAIASGIAYALQQ